MLIVGMSSCMILAYPLAWLMHQTDAAAIATAQMTFAALLALYMASIPAAMCEMFPHSVRVSAVSVGYGLAYAVFGGTAPAVAVWLISRTGNDLAFAWYIVVLTAVSLTVAFTTRERRGEPLA
jgi:MHS family proline/betaine transporter-like MFS transporter